MLIETEYRVQVEEDIKPFRDVLMGFFVTIGVKPNMETPYNWRFVLLVVDVILILRRWSPARSSAPGAYQGNAIRTGFH